MPRFGQAEYFLADMPMSKLAMAEPIGIFIYNYVFERFPDLNFGFLEGGVGWACNLHADLIGHWKKRNREAMHRDLKPSNLDVAAVRELMKKYTAGNPHFEGRIDGIVPGNMHIHVPHLSMDEQARRDLDSNEFGAVNIRDVGDVNRRFARNFFFGCEADDPTTMFAFDPRMKVRLKAVFSSDIGHWDVPHIDEVLPEVDEARQEEVVHRVRDIILGGGGTWDAIDPWGRRKLAFPIRKREEGDYWVIRFTSDAASLAEAERVLRITDEVLRHQSVHQARPSRKTEAAAGS